MSIMTVNELNQLKLYRLSWSRRRSIDLSKAWGGGGVGGGGGGRTSSN